MHNVTIFNFIRNNEQSQNIRNMRNKKVRDQTRTQYRIKSSISIPKP